MSHASNQSVMEVDLLWGQLDRREKELNMSKIGARCVGKRADGAAQAALPETSSRQILDKIGRVGVWVGWWERGGGGGGDTL